MAKKEPKTNAMRMLERAKIPFEVHRYECKEFIDGITIADMLNEPYERVFKTLVTEGKSGGIHGGHRQRMRERLKTSGVSSFADHELLEMLLYNIFPRKERYENKIDGPVAMIYALAMCMSDIEKDEIDFSVFADDIIVV